jgi:hypothetical protein
VNIDALSADKSAVVRISRLIAATAGLAAVASLGVTAHAAGSSPTVQAQQLAAAQKAFAAAQSAVDAKLIQTQETTNVATGCSSVSRALPKSEQQAEFRLLFTYVVVSGAEALAPVFVAHDRDVAALHLTDPALSVYAAALHKVALLVAPLLSAKGVGVCTMLGRWEKGGYPKTGANVIITLFGMTAAQAGATEFADDSNPVMKALTKARKAADIRLRALGVTPVTFKMPSP